MYWLVWSEYALKLLKMHTRATCQLSGFIKVHAESQSTVMFSIFCILHIRRHYKSLLLKPYQYSPKICVTVLVVLSHHFKNFFRQWYCSLLLLLLLFLLSFWDSHGPSSALNEAINNKNLTKCCPGFGL